MQAKPDLTVPLPNTSAGLSQVGGKGASLARMAAAGLPVPPGFHVTTAAYRQFVAEHNLQEQILTAVYAATADQPATLEEASSRIGQLFAQRAMPEDIAEAIRRAYAELGEGDVPVAVRSSAIAEDLPSASFAGQQETYLNIRGTEAVLEAVKKCWASLWTARAIAYRARQGIAPDAAALAVVVQELVLADVAGILFTANPADGKSGEIVINAAWGLGESIVSGAVTPDTLTVEKKSGRIIRRETADKQTMVVRAEFGTREAPVPSSQSKRPVLADAQAEELAELGVRIEKMYEMPMDIEWALREGRVFILQARPITALPEPPLEWTLSQPHSIAARLSFVEFIPDIVPPLFATLAVPLATQATSKMMAEVLRPVPADDPLPVLDTLKVYLAGQGRNPHTRLQAQAEQRRQGEQTITMRLDPLRRKWFRKLLQSAQDRAPGRENAIADLGLTYPQIRRLLRELGLRLVAGGALGQRVWR
jgi:hypothetical protein